MARTCCVCKAALPENAGTEWGYKLGVQMYFCTYKCMRQKQAEMDAKRSATMKRREEEKKLRRAEKARQEELLKMENEKSQETVEKVAPVAQEHPAEMEPAEKLTLVMELDEARTENQLLRHQLERKAMRVDVLTVRNKQLLRMVREMAEMIEVMNGEG